MKAIILILLALLSTNLLGQIEKPKNGNCGIVYMDDLSIGFGYGFGNSLDKSSIPENKISELITIFEKADKLSEYCKDNSSVEIVKIIDTLIVSENIKCKEIKIRGKKINVCNKIQTGYQITFKFNGHGSQLLIENIKGTDVVCEIIENENGRFVWLLTTERDRYYRKLNAFNQSQKQIQNELDALLK